MPNEALAARSVGFTGATLASKSRDYKIIAIAYWNGVPRVQRTAAGCFHHLPRL